jgi:dTDP-4-dehydrorhamnose reductase
MKILLLGNTGQLGWELHRTLQPLGEVVALDYPEVNMADATNIRNTVQEHRPDIIINATAYTAVDKAESEPDLAEAINGIGPGILAEETRKLNAILIHYSTDYVFDGKKGQPYVETDVPNPINVYGLTKLHGEQAIQQVDGVHLIIRTSWVYSLRRESFVSKVMEWSRTQETLRIVDDQIGNPTWARMLAEATLQVIAQGRNDPVGYLFEKSGLYHLAGSGFANRLEWALAILKLDPKRHEQKAKKILPALTSDFPVPARRPSFSAIDCRKIKISFGLSIPLWEDSLRLALSA